MRRGLPRLLRLAGALALLCCQRDSSPATLLAVYMPGGNLEDRVLVRGFWTTDENGVLPVGQHSPFGAASDDLRELATGYAQLTDAQRRKVSLWVAFGGALKSGWQGVRYASGDCLVADAGDDLFGNADCYAFRDGEADMAAPPTVEAFLRFIGDRQPSAGERSLLTLWGQGASFRGLLYDSAKQEVPLTRLEDLLPAFPRARAHFDVLAIDASLMGTLEAATTLRPAASQMVLAPGVMPGHGFDYSGLVRAAAQPGRADLLGRAIVDGYFEGESIHLNPISRTRERIPHRTSRAKSLLLVDSGQLDHVLPLLDRLTALAAANDPAIRLLRALSGAAPRGVQPHSGDAHAVNLGDTLAALQPPAGAASTVVAELEAALARAVPRTRADLAAPDAGLGIFSPLSATLWRGHYQGRSLITPAWQAFVDRVGEHRQNSTTRPDILAITTVAGTLKVTLRDTSGVVRLRELHVRSPSGVPLVMSNRPLADSQEETGQAVVHLTSAPASLWLCDGRCASGRRVAVPTTTLLERPDGTLLSAALGVRTSSRPDLELEEAIVMLAVGAGGEITDHWVLSVESDTNDDLLFSKDQYRLSADLTVQFRAPSLDDLLMSPRLEPAGEPLALQAPSVEWQWGPPPAEGGPSLIYVLASAAGSPDTLLPVRTATAARSARRKR